MREETLRMERVSYERQGILQLERLDLSIYQGEIMGLLAVRGHGLTSLVELLQKNLPLAYGHIYYNEELLNSWRTPNPKQNRIAVIQSASSLVEGLTVADNIFVLRRGFRTFFIRPTLLQRQLQPVLDEIGIDIRADSYVEGLSTFQRFVVELIKAIVSGCRLIILRDVGTFVSETELAELHRIVRHYRDKGLSFLYIGYHFEELSMICNRTALLVNGRIIKVLPHGTKLEGCADHYEDQVRRQLSSQDHSREKVHFRAVSLSGGQVEDLSFCAVGGECLVLQDLDNRIFDSLQALILGQIPLHRGRLFLEELSYHPQQDRSVAFLKEDPTNTMLFPDMSYLDNLCFTMDHRLPQLWHNHRIRRGLVQAYANLVEDGLFSKRVKDLNSKQKYDLVYHRILLQSPKVVFCTQPFKGVDTELRMHIWELLHQLMEHGIAVVILAVNLSDSLALASTLIRIQRNGENQIIRRKDFAHIDLTAPWVEIYRSMDGGTPDNYT